MVGLVRLSVNMPLCSLGGVGGVSGGGKTQVQCAGILDQAFFIPPAALCALAMMAELAKMITEIFGDTAPKVTAWLTESQVVSPEDFGLLASSEEEVVTGIIPPATLQLSPCSSSTSWRRRCALTNQHMVREPKR